MISHQPKDSLLNDDPTYGNPTLALALEPLPKNITVRDDTHPEADDEGSHVGTKNGTKKEEADKSEGKSSSDDETLNIIAQALKEDMKDETKEAESGKAEEPKKEAETGKVEEPKKETE